MYILRFRFHSTRCLISSFQLICRALEINSQICDFINIAAIVVFFLFWLSERSIYLSVYEDGEQQKEEAQNQSILPGWGMSVSVIRSSVLRIFMWVYFEHRCFAWWIFHSFVVISNTLVNSKWLLTSLQFRNIFLSLIFAAAAVAAPVVVAVVFIHAVTILLLLSMWMFFVLCIILLLLWFLQKRMISLPCICSFVFELHSLLEYGKSTKR